MLTTMDRVRGGGSDINKTSTSEEAYTVLTIEVRYHGEIYKASLTQNMQFAHFSCFGRFAYIYAIQFRPPWTEGRECL